MGLDKLIQSLTVLAILVIGSGNLPKVLMITREAQLQLIQETKASKREAGFHACQIRICGTQLVYAGHMANSLYRRHR